MSRTAKTNLFFVFLAVLTTFIIYACSDNSVNNNNNPTTFSLGGTITFVDTTRVYSGGSYTVSAFTTWPPAGAPSGFAVLNPVKVDTTYTATYSIAGLSNGGYFLASAWTKEPYVTGGNYVLGTHGCDTANIMSCMPDTVKVSGANVTGKDFRSFIDTANALINF